MLSGEIVELGSTMLFSLTSQNEVIYYPNNQAGFQLVVDAS